MFVLMRLILTGAALGALASLARGAAESAAQGYVDHGLIRLAGATLLGDSLRDAALGAAVGALAALPLLVFTWKRSATLDSAPAQTPTLTPTQKWTTWCAGGIGVLGSLGAVAWVGFQEIPWSRYWLETPASERVAHAFGALAYALAFGLALALAARGSRALARASLGVLAVVALAQFAAVLGRTKPDGPNLLFISIDTLRADRLGAYGYIAAKTANLDALAREGTVWETVIASAPVTLNSMATLMTGVDPQTHGARYNGFYRLRRDPVTLAERLADRGYRTAAVVGNFALDHSFGIDQGFQSFDDHMTRTMDGTRKNAAEKARDTPRIGKNWWQKAVNSHPAQRRADEVTDAGLQWLKKSGDAPFFLWVHYMDPHLPYAPPAAYRVAARPYDGEVTYVDIEIGRLLDGLTPKRETLIVIVGDHGESLGEHGVKGHVFSLYEQALHIPLIMHLPGRVPAGKRIAAPLRGREVQGEILLRLGIQDKPPANTEPAEDWWAYAETYHPQITRGGAPLRALRGARWKYIHQEGGVDELYDLALDPGEEHNLASEKPDLAASLRAKLAREIAGDDTPLPVEPETMERLRDLGYVD